MPSRELYKERFVFDLTVDANVLILPQDFTPSRSANSVRLVLAVQAALPPNVFCRFTKTSTPAKIITTRLVVGAELNRILPPIIIPARPDVSMNFALSQAGTIIVAFLEESFAP